jgi:hypothetical protein
VALVAEDEFLLGMAVVVAAGFAAVDAGEADEAIEIPESPPDVRLHV